MKLLAISLGLLLAALAVFFVPVSFSVDGFGLVVNPGGVRTVRAAEAGTVLHFPSDEGRFHPGRIVTAVAQPEDEAKNQQLLEAMRRQVAKGEADHLDKMTKLVVDLERAKAKRVATDERLKARKQLVQERTSLMVALREHTQRSDEDLESLNQERLSQLERLEDLVRRSGEVAAMPSQKQAKTLDEIQAGRVALISTESARVSSSKLVLDMQQELNGLYYSNAIDEAEIDILTNQIEDLNKHANELKRLREATVSEAEATYMAKLAWPQLAISGGEAIDMRAMQANRAVVARNDPLRLLEERSQAVGLSILIHGQPDEGQVLINTGDRDVIVDLPVNPDQVAGALTDAGLSVANVYTDNATVGIVKIRSVFAELAELPARRPSILSSWARSSEGVPVAVQATLSGFEAPKPQGSEGEATEIVGFLENRYAVVLEPGQTVKGKYNDTQGVTKEVHFTARLLDRDFSTVDTNELGIRLGNKSLAAKILKRGILSQVVIEVDDSSAALIEKLPGAVVQLSFPLARQSLFNFLVTRNAAI
jgi:hypothetical protein